MFNCVACNKVFTRKDSLERHMKIHDVDHIKHTCNLCRKSFTRKYNLCKHEKTKHGLTRNQPDIQQAVIELADNIIVPDVAAGPSSDLDLWGDNDETDMLAILEENERHGLIDDDEDASRKRKGENSAPSKKIKRGHLNFVGNSSGFIEVGESFNKIVTWYYHKNTENIFVYSAFLKSIKQNLINLLRSHSSIRPIKFNLKLESTYIKPHVENSSEDRAFKTSARAVYTDSDIGEVIDDMFAIILTEQDVYQGKGSGFSLESIDGILLGVYKYTPIGGSSYIKLPADIDFKKAVINPQNNDEQCFKWAILAKYVIGSSKYRVGDNYKQYEEKYNFNCLTFPTPLNQIKIFEKNNKTTSVNVYGLKQEKKDGKEIKSIVYPVKIVKEEKPDHFDILLVADEEKTHYTYISNFSRLIRSQITKHEGEIAICKSCFTCFDNQKKINKLAGKAALDEHKLICGSHKPIIPKMPVEGSILEFEGWSKTQRHPVVIYADFEALLEKCDEKKGKSTTVIQQHKPMSYGLYVKAVESISQDLLEEYNIPTTIVIHRGSESNIEVAKHFVETVVEISRKIEDLLKINKKMIITTEQREAHKICTECNLCKKKFSSLTDKVQDHCHLSGQFRQTLCNKCNLALKTPRFVPCFFHNLSHYDAHFIINELGYDGNSIKVIPSSEEKFISFTKYISNKFSIRFIDTFRFMASSLAALASNLTTAEFGNFRETSKVFSSVDMPLVTRKGVYPYEYTDCWKVLEETNLPSRKDFYSTLTESDIANEEYNHALNVWKRFDCKTLGEYSDLYLKIDVLLLADVFENFRDLCTSTYNLDPAFYFTAPGLSFDACLKFTAIRLQLITNYDMLLMFEKGIRGGLTQSIMRYGKANNTKTIDYDSTKPKSWIIYQDCNNLYGWAMSEYMPSGGFKWVEPTLIGLDELMDTSDIGRIYEVDISYPSHLHNKHNDLPFLPNNTIPPGSNISKLMATFERKERYIIHYRNLKQAITNGLIVEKVHRTLEFQQSPWLANYINLNTGMRKKAVNDFEKDFYKLMNNSVFGKTMESMRKRIEMEIVSSEVRLMKLINKVTFKYCTEFENKKLMAVTMEKKIVDFRKPIYIGFSVLEISKTLMYDYHYNVLKKFYGDKIILMYTDTDSLIYYIYTEDFYADLKNNSILLNRVDTSDLPKDHPCHTLERKKVPGFFSDEVNGKTMLEFVALRAKSYAFSVGGEDRKNEIIEKIKAKGIRGHVVKNHMTLEDYKKCLFDDDSLEKYTENVSIRSFNHQIKTIKTNKLTFNKHDDKRFILENGVHTLAHGHYRINELLDEEL